MYVGTPLYFKPSNTYMKLKLYVRVHARVWTSRCSFSIYRGLKSNATAICMYTLVQNTSDVKEVAERKPKTRQNECMLHLKGDVAPPICFHLVALSRVDGAVRTVYNYSWLLRKCVYRRNPRRNYNYARV